MPSKGLLTTGEAAQLYDFSPSYVAQLAQRGKVLAHKYGRDWLIDAKDMERYYQDWKARKPGPRPRQQEGGQE